MNSMPKALGVAAVMLATLMTPWPQGFALEPPSKERVPAREAGPQEAQLPGQALDFQQRCADPNVILCDSLDDGPVRGAGITAKTKNATLAEALQGRYRDWRWCQHVAGVKPATPSLDRAMKASGSGSLKFTVPTNSGSGSAGNCQINFTPDHSVQFGEGETFFVQFRVRLSCELLFVDCDPKSPTYKQARRTYRAKPGTTGFKVSIINAGDHPGLEHPPASCTAQELVLVDGGQGIVAGYHSCNWYDSHRFNLGLHPRSGWVYEDRQPIRRKRDDVIRGCYNVDPGTGMPAKAMWRECILWVADEWLTITQQITVGRWTDKVDDPARSSNVRVWIAREGEKPVRVIDYSRNLQRPEKPFMKYGKIWLLPYMTNKDPSEVHPEAHMWFDELIVSRGPIAPAR